MYIKLTNDVPEKYTIGQLRRDNPQVSFPKKISDATLAEYDVYPLVENAKPSYDPTTEKVVEGTPVRQGNRYIQMWSVFPATPEESKLYLQNLQNEITTATQQRLDEFARTRGYDGVLSLCTYATSANSKFKREGQYGVEVRDATWTTCYRILADAQSGQRPIPEGYAEIESELPELVWPV